MSSRRGTCARALLLALSLAAATARQDAAILYLADGDERRLADLAASIARLDAHFNGVYKYPVVIFHDVGGAPGRRGGGEGSDAPSSSSSSSPPPPPPLTPAHQDRLQRGTSSPLIFAPVDLASYAGAAAVGAPALALGRFPLGYRHMCNFFSGPVALEPALAPFRYYWRFDTDSYLVADVGYDVFDRMAERGWRYGWATKQCDWDRATDGLVDVAEAVFSRDVLERRLEADMTAPGVCARSPAPGTGVASDSLPLYNNRIYYNNFEVVDLEVLRSAAYQSFYAAVARAGGIYSTRWGDAPIRTLGIRALLADAAIHHFDDISYVHQNLYGPAARYAILLAALLGVAVAVVAARLLVLRPGSRALMVYVQACALLRNSAGRVAAHPWTGAAAGAVVALVDLSLCLRQRWLRRARRAVFARGGAGARGAPAALRPGMTPAGLGGSPSKLDMLERGGVMMISGAAGGGSSSSAALLPPPPPPPPPHPPPPAGPPPHPPPRAPPHHLLRRRGGRAPYPPPRRRPRRPDASRPLVLALAPGHLARAHLYRQRGRRRRGGPQQQQRQPHGCCGGEGGKGCRPSRRRHRSDGLAPCPPPRGRCRPPLPG
jgi:hypothetical protein